jgi:hypothetical protein
LSLKSWPVGEWEFYQVSESEVHLYRHRDGWLLRAIVDDKGICNIYNIPEYLPLYVKNQLREMLDLVEC